ncbi:unnamed protein product, partial [Polarella glacialis]
APVPRDLAKDIQTRISREVEDLDELWAVVGEHLPEHFDEGHAVSCLARAAELGLRSAGGSDSPEGLQQLVEALREPLQTGRLQPSSLARLASALAVQTQSRATEFGALEAALQHFDCDCSCLLHGVIPGKAAVLARALANLGRPDALVSLLDGVADRAPAIGSRALAGIVWAAASARLRDVAGGSWALDACIDEAAQRGDRLKPQALANLVWAMGALRKRREPALRALLPHVASLELLGKEAAQKAEGLASSEVGALLWSSVALRLRSSELLGALQARILPGTRNLLLPGTTGQATEGREVRGAEVDLKGPADFRAVAGLIWAKSCLEPESGKLESGLLRGLQVSSAAQAQPHELAALALGVARLRLAHGPALEVAADEVERRAGGGFSPQDCAGAARGFVVAGFGSRDGLLGALSSGFLEAAAKPLSQEDNGRDWADMAEALSASSGSPLAATPQTELLAAYEDAVLDPLVRLLRSVCRDGASGSEKSRGNLRSLKALEQFAASLGLARLGGSHTHAALVRAGIVAPADPCADSWITDARLSADNATKLAAPAWLSFDMTVSLGGEQARLLEPGRRVLTASGGAPVQGPCGELRPLSLPGIPTSSLTVGSSSMANAADQAHWGPGAEAKVSGQLKLYIHGAPPCFWASGCRPAGVWGAQ